MGIISNIFRAFKEFSLRIWRIFSSEAHSAIDKMENTIKMTEQGIRELKENLGTARISLAQAKAQAIGASRAYNAEAEKPKIYEQKALALLQKSKDGQLNEEEAESLAMQALSKKERCEKEVAVKKEIYERLKATADNFETQVQNLQTEIAKWEQEAQTLKSRKNFADTQLTLRKQLSGIDSSSTISMLKRMQEQVEEQEAMAQAHNELAIENKSLEDKIDAALSTTTTKTKDSLEALKKQLS